MSTVNALSEHLSKLGLQLQSPNSVDSYPELNPVDVWRLAITKDLAKVTGVDESLVYPAIQWTQTLDKGDLNIAVPRLRVKGKPNDQAQKWAEDVCDLQILKPIR